MSATLTQFSKLKSSPPPNPQGKRKAKPFLKWAGGKGQLVEEIRKFYPTELGRSIDRYAEPFVGGGAILFDILSTYSIREVYISDSNKELINVYTCLRDSPRSLIALLKKYESEYLPLTDEFRREIYYRKRKQFNALKKKGKDGCQIAALFVFLNKTCFNGLYRVNSKGEFNVPMGRYKHPSICDATNLQNASDLLKGADIRCADYRDSESFIDQNTFVYFDPPYRPLSLTSSFTSYTEQSFNDDCQRELAQYIKHLDAKNIYVVASNSDPKNTDVNDDFFDNLYAGMEINRISATRMINSRATSRGVISELLICSKRR